MGQIKNIKLHIVTDIKDHLNTINLNNSTPTLPTTIWHPNNVCDCRMKSTLKMSSCEGTCPKHRTLKMTSMQSDQYCLVSSSLLSLDLPSSRSFRVSEMVHRGVGERWTGKGGVRNVVDAEVMVT